MKKYILVLFCLFSCQLFGDPATGKIKISANELSSCITALSTIANYGHEQIVKQGSEPDKIIHVPAQFGGDSGVVTWSIAHDLAVMNRALDDYKKVTDSLITQSKQLVADGHATYTANGIASSDSIGSAKIKEINDGMDKANKELIELNVTFFAEVDFRTDENPGLAVPLAELLKVGLIPSHDGTVKP